eukprot:Seg4232.3 transcript_id=Seg4232.3/GoldUCD/mRNA.D3Y31 product="hypothetical protein" protein_id=Seg4232.3/GoldUCD/D3Y31
MAGQPVEPPTQQPQIARQLSSPMGNIQTQPNATYQVQGQGQQPVPTQQMPQTPRSNMEAAGPPVNQTHQPMPRPLHTSSYVAVHSPSHLLNANYYNGDSYSRMPLQRSYDYYFPLEDGSSNA